MRNADGMDTHKHPTVTVADLKTRPTVSIPEAGAALGCSRDNAYKQARAGLIPTIQIGHRLRVPTARLLAMLEGRA